ncbi:MAG: hypothetical protein OEX08_00465 [Candidatus Nomurabacteria bacterium]|nr:hypothetical protein [Candidatus Nomurabacteria bacterium]
MFNFKKKKHLHRPYYFTASSLFFVVAILHLLRASMELPLFIGNYSMPLWISIVVGVLLLFLSYRGFYRVWEMRK